jgi:RNA polymerase sigma-70 factor, ECF subfamily
MHLDGFSNSEIADFIGIKLNNLNVKLHRIKEKAVLNLKRSQWD